jgi:site-specific DNA-methyltransferase (adenine-specific)
MGKFILGDCMDLETGLPSYPDGFFDLAIVDPPYGIGMAANPVRQKHKKKAWDLATPTSAYFDELFRVSKNQIIWGGNYFSLPPTKGFVFWKKDNPAPSFADGEFAWTSFNRPARCADLRYYGTINNGLFGAGKIHPTQKPAALYRWLLENYAKPGQLILDTHVGSASSLIACESMGFDYVGFEIDPDYYAAAKNRMSKGIQAVLI